MHKQTLILIHGAWHGGWCWEPLLPLLTPDFDVITPTLPGHDGQIEQMHWSAYLAHLDKVMVELTEPAILLGHSMAGLLITQLAERHPDKIANLIYLAAFIPQPGDSMQSTIGKLPMPVENPAIAITDDRKKLVLRHRYVADYFYHLCPSEWVEKALSLLCDQDASTFRESIDFNPEQVKKIKRDYLICEQDRAICPNAQKQMALSLGCQLHTLNSDHSPFASRPKELADAIIRSVSPNTRVFAAS